MPGRQFNDYTTTNAKAKEACREIPGQPIKNVDTANKCQELCRQCKDCKFFHFKGGALYCHLWYTDENEAVSNVKDNGLSRVGPKVCGNIFKQVITIHHIIFCDNSL